MFSKPVVATDVGGMREIVSDGVSGVLVQPDDPAALTSALQRLIDSPELRDRIGRGGRDAYVESFTLDTMAENAERFYRALMGLPVQGVVAATA